MSAITIIITQTRALTVEGRLVAGEAADVSIVGAVPSALYLVAPDQTVVAACESWTAGESSGTGVLQLATEQVAALFANTPAGRMIAVWALINDAGGDIAGAGWIPVLSAPMPDELIDLDIDFYLRASQIGAGLAIVDGKLVCTVNPENYLTKTEAAATYATQTALAAKYSKPATGIPASDLAASVQTSLGKADSAAPAADLRYAIGVESTPDEQTGNYPLQDRAVNIIQTSAASIVVDFPAAVVHRARDFFVYIGSSATGDGNISFEISDPTIGISTPDGNLPDIPKGADIILYFAEITDAWFLMRGEPLVMVQS